jgi:DNA-binding NarL/FixJ family response regulator
MKRVLVVAASAVVRAGLEAIINARATLEAVGSSPGVDGLVEQVEALRPDVILIDLEGSGEGHGPGLLPLAAASSSSAVVLLTDERDGATVAEALRLGVRAILPRQAEAEEIVAAVEAAAVGLVVLHAEESGPLLPVLSSLARNPTASQIESLTPREVEVLGMLAEGEGNKQIARRLSISEHTVKFHVGSILAKLGASSRTEAVAIGVRQGLIML